MPHLVLKESQSFASQVKNANTIYEVASDFDLKGATVSLPAGVTLQFNGGSLRNGVVSGNQTTLSGIMNAFLDNVTLQGSFSNSESDLCWWGCIPYVESKQVDNTANIQCAFNSTIKVINVSKLYGISSPIELPGSSRIQGVCSWYFKQSGFIANDNFSTKTITLSRDGQKYSAKGMFWHCYDKHPVLRDISIVPNKKAHFAVEQIAGYSWCDMDNVYIEGALTAGILQYGAEQPFFRRVCVRDSYFGVLVSTKRLLDTDVCYPSGPTVSMCNIVNFAECNFSGCNYGCVVMGGSNYVFDNCKTAYNAICGLMIIATSAVINNYYTEGDGICNFWIEKSSGKKNASKSKANVLKALSATTERRDGFASKYNTAYDGEVYYRAPVVVKKSNVQINGAYMSVKPRGDGDTNVQKIVEATPTENIYGGIDAFFLVQESGLTVNNLSAYLHSSGATSNAYPFATVIDLAPENTSTAMSRVKIEQGIRSNGDWSPTIYATSNSKAAAGSACYYMDGPRYDALRSWYSLSSPVHDYNAGMESRLYGSSSKYDFRVNEFVECFNGFPLYKKAKRDYLYLSKSSLREKYGDKRQLKIVAYVKVLEDFTGILNFKTSFVNKSYGNEKGGNALNASTCSFKKGVYRLEMVADLSPKQSLGIDKAWEYMKVSLYGDASSESRCLFSDIYFYDPEDGQMLPHTFVDGYQK